MTTYPRQPHRLRYMLALVLAGEAVFALPFHVTRFFRPAVLDVFDLSHTELGAAQGVYGVVALLSYFPGGLLADRLPARTLLTLSLFATAFGGLYMSTFPDYRGALYLWGFFGLSTILLFWAALIRATREWGGHDAQGRAFGILDGGRGLAAAALATAGAAVFTSVFPVDTVPGPSEKANALRGVIYGYTAVTAIAAFWTWFALPTGADPRGKVLDGRAGWCLDALRVIRIPSVWLTAIIVICAYVGYKGFDFYALYAVEGFGMGQAEAARLVAIGAWMRPLAAVSLGWLGDRYMASRMCLASFAALLATQLFLALFSPAVGAAWVLYTNVLLGSVAVFGLRALYFALLEESSVPAALTGTAVGLISALGFTPDIFVSYAIGLLLDQSPGLPGYQHAYWFLGAFSAAGVLTSAALMVRLHGPTAVVPRLRNACKREEE